MIIHIAFQSFEKPYLKDDNIAIFSKFAEQYDKI